MPSVKAPSMDFVSDLSDVDDMKPSLSVSDNRQSAKTFGPSAKKQSLGKSGNNQTKDSLSGEQKYFNERFPELAEERLRGRKLAHHTLIMIV
jgi:hypothetical protein